MMHTKTLKTSSPGYAKGGKGKMAGKTGVGTSVAGTSNPGAGTGSGKWAKGGSAKMAGKTGASPAKAC